MKRKTGVLIWNTFSDYTTGKVMSSIKEMLPVEVEVLRNGAKTSVDPKNLVLGDLVCKPSDREKDTATDASTL